MQSFPLQQLVTIDDYYAISYRFLIGMHMTLCCISIKFVEGYHDDEHYTLESVFLELYSVGICIPWY